jgi:hypothetical protein
MQVDRSGGQVETFPGITDIATTVRLNAELGSLQYQAMNLSIAYV